MSWQSGAIPCLDCKERPQWQDCRCRECFPIYNAALQRAKRARRAQRRALTPDHTRLCIDCRQPFLSRQGMNLCGSCEHAVWDEAERSTPLRTNKTVRREQLLTALYRRYGHAYKASVKPRIPLSEISVLQSAGRKR